jgi:hypothetical protein
MPRNRTAAHHARLHLERLEDRAVPATFTVTTALDVVSDTDGKLSLREAISQANTHVGADAVVLPAGVFKIALDGSGENGNATGDFDVTDAVTIRGAGAGLTAIDAQHKDRLFDLLGSIQVKFVDLTLRHGAAPIGVVNGAAVQAQAAGITLVRCVVSDNQGLLGGGINAETGDVTVFDSAVRRNVAQIDGGGIRLGSSALVMSGSTVRRNLAGGAGGGGIFAGGTATLTNCTVSGNSVSGTGTGGGGGGIDAVTANLTNCTVSGNSTPGGFGGGINAQTATLTRSTVSGNTAGSGLGGGGIKSDTATLVNCTVCDNSTPGGVGGGVLATAAALLNCTVAENDAGLGGGLFHQPGGTFSLKNTIVALNLADFGGSGSDAFGNFASGGHNLIGDGADETGFANGASGDIVGTTADPIDPRLGLLANNGGPTATMALRAGSPAIDAGDNNAVNPVTGKPLAADQRGFGFPRQKDGNGDGISVVDIGAFEL